MTSPAVGIHAHPSKKLGVRPEDTARPKVPVGPFLRVAATVLPAYPATDVIPELAYPMDRNDEAGDCVVAGVDHALQVIYRLLTGQYINWSDDQLLHAYQSQNPGFKSWADAGGASDGGMVIAEFLDWCIKQGLILAYGKIDHTNQAEVEATVWLGLAVVTGENLQVAQQSGTVWDDVPGSSDWGGHCTVWNGYFPFRVISWGADDYTMTEGFVQYRVSEAYFILTQAHVDHPSFRDHFDLAGFAAAVAQLTAGKVIVPTGPTPTPPAPGAAPFPGAAVAVGQHVAAAAARAHLSVTDWLNHHFDTYFGIKP